MVTNFLFSKVGAQFLRRRFGLVRILHSIVCTDFLFCFPPEGLKQFINMLGQQMVDLNTSLTAVTYMECIRRTQRADLEKIAGRFTNGLIYQRMLLRSAMPEVRNSALT